MKIRQWLNCILFTSRLGLDPKTFSDIINSSTGRCWSSEIYNPVPGICQNAPCNNDYKGGFSTSLITKVCDLNDFYFHYYWRRLLQDLGLANGVATASDTPIPMGAIAHQIYRTLQTKGLGNKDFSIVYEFLKNNSTNWFNKANGLLFYNFCIFFLNFEL